MSIQLVLAACQQIKQNGKKPSTALIKAKLGSSVPLAQIIKGIQTFANNPDISIDETPIQEVAIENESTCGCDKKIRQLSQHVLVLEKQLIALQAQVSALSKP